MDTALKMWMSTLGEGWTDSLPNKAAEIAVVSNNKYYYMGDDAKVAKVYQWSSSQWNFLSYDAKRIAAARDGTLVPVGLLAGNIYYKTGTMQGVTGAKGVAVSGEGLMYWISSNGDVYCPTNYNQKGVVVGHTCAKILVTDDKTVVIHRSSFYCTRRYWHNRMVMIPIIEYMMRLERASTRVRMIY